VDDRPVAWVSVGPREDFELLARSRVLAPVDEHSVWSVTCFFVHKDCRRRGLSVAALRAAAEYARDHGATLIEGYPIDPRNEETPPVFAYTGLLSAYRRAGFREVARRSPTRPILRKTLRRGSPPSRA
jgi:GNAT superfamily N-acetyltransferase